MIRISVVIPSFNSGRYLAAAIESALSQNPPPFEVIVQDGGSTDETLQVLRTFGNRVDWRTEPDSGQSDALNRAIRRSTGEAVVWLNADDLLLPGAFEAASAAFERRPDAQFVYGDFDMIGADGRRLRRYQSSDYAPRRVFVHGCYIFSGAIFYRRSLMDRIGPFDERLHACMDFDYLLRLGHVPFVHINLPVASFRMSGAGKSSTIRSRFLKETHLIRWRTAGDSIYLRFLTLALDVWSIVALWTQPIRLTGAWSAVRQGKRL
jgi:glycosyltransferase involved in cell wall biosynthesis